MKDKRSRILERWLNLMKHKSLLYTTNFLTGKIGHEQGHMKCKSLTRDQMISLIAIRLILFRLKFKYFFEEKNIYL